MAADAVRVMTMNLLSPDHADWPSRRTVLRSGLRELRPDVVALQETVWGGDDDQAADLLGPEYEVARHSARSANGVGAVLASRWPLGAVHELDMHVTARVDDLPWAAAVVAEVALPAPFGRTVFVHHKPTYQVGYARERELQAVACAGFVEDRVGDRDVHVVLLGDFDEVADCRRVFDQAVEGIWASDHFGILADLRVPAHPPGDWI